jgi:hypothetical protein
VFYGVVIWIPIILIGAAVYLGDRIANMMLVQKQVIGFVWLAGILAILVLVLLTLAYLKNRKGGGNGGSS